MRFHQNLNSSLTFWNWKIKKAKMCWSRYLHSHCTFLNLRFWYDVCTDGIKHFLRNVVFRKLWAIQKKIFYWVRHVNCLLVGSSMNRQGRSHQVCKLHPNFVCTSRRCLDGGSDTNIYTSTIALSRRTP